MISSSVRRSLVVGLTLVALASLLLVFHNYGHPILPRKHVGVQPAQLTPYSAEHPKVLVLPFDHSEPNLPGIDRSAVFLFEDGVPYSNADRNPAAVLLVGGRRWVHESGRIIFSSSNNSDPRTNGSTYSLTSPILYTRTIGHLTLLLFALSTTGLYALLRRSGPTPSAVSTAPALQPGLRWRWHVAGATLFFLGGLYCNTGTLTPYAITTFPHVAKGSGYLYNPDHVHFRALSDFAQGDDRSRWDGAIMLRRILFPVLAWPFIKLAGFEVGGTVASLMLNAAAFLWCAHLLRRRIGERGTLFSLWLFALYPGTAYWAGLPYPYALICPLSLLLLIGLQDLPDARGAKFILLSLAMGVAYLAYDFTAFFVPAAFVLLCWHRRFGAAMLSGLCQLLPIAAWTLILTKVFHQSLDNSNTAAYHAILAAYSQASSIAHLVTQLVSLPETLMEVFFGANFLFLPGLFLMLLAVNPLTSRVRLSHSEVVLLLVALGLFLFNHLAPPYGGWQMRGAWISRLYQPVFPVFILFAGRWWGQLPPLRRAAHFTLGLALAGFSMGNALILFGPILNNPWRVSEIAFYRFYNHNDRWFYERSLEQYGRRPLGFPTPRP
jgi:hypothetical protein